MIRFQNIIWGSWSQPSSYKDSIFIISEFWLSLITTIFSSSQVFKGCELKDSTKKTMKKNKNLKAKKFINNDYVYNINNFQIGFKCVDFGKSAVIALGAIGFIDKRDS